MHRQQIYKRLEIPQAFTRKGTGMLEAIKISVKKEYLKPSTMKFMDFLHKYYAYDHRGNMVAKDYLPNSLKEMLIVQSLVRGKKDLKKYLKNVSDRAISIRNHKIRRILKITDWKKNQDMDEAIKLALKNQLITEKEIIAFALPRKGARELILYAISRDYLQELRKKFRSGYLHEDEIEFLRHRFKHWGRTFDAISKVIFAEKRIAVLEKSVQLKLQTEDWGEIKILFEV